jgi:hypothetical protein
VSNQRKPRGDRPTTPVPRADAVSDIAAHIADRDAFVISVPPALIATAAGRFSELPICTWYCGNGSGIVMRLAVASIPVIEAVDMLLPGMTAAVAIVPKTVPAARLATALSHITEIPEDGSRDLVLLQDDSGVIVWPRLLVDALALVDPAIALQLAANDLSRMS